MRKILTGLVAVAALGAAAVVPSSTAEARWWGRGWGWGPGPFFAGAVIGGGLAAPYYYGYYPYGPYPYYRCRPVWNGYAWARGCY
jgi:hypothetical protein